MPKTIQLIKRVKNHEVFLCFGYNMINLYLQLKLVLSWLVWGRTCLFYCDPKKMFMTVFSIIPPACVMFANAAPKSLALFRGWMPSLLSYRPSIYPPFTLRIPFFLILSYTFIHQSSTHQWMDARWWERPAAKGSNYTECRSGRTKLGN